MDEEGFEEKLLRLAKRAKAHLSTQSVCFTEEADNYGFSWTPSLEELSSKNPKSFKIDEKQPLQSQYLSVLRNDPVFHNPGSHQLMAGCYGLEPYFSFKYGYSPLTWDYKTIQQGRNQHISNQLTIDGINLCRKSKYEEALRLLKQAIELFPTNVDALVAIGACSANMGNMTEAISQLEAALSLNPNDTNALLYLERTKAQLAQQTKDSPIPSTEQRIRSKSSRRESTDSMNKIHGSSPSKGKNKKHSRKSSDDDDESLGEGQKKRKKEHKKHKKKKRKSSASSSSALSPRKPEVEEEIHPILSRSKSRLWG
jgi:tetratricopeptide (TPR) repeat protein